MPDEPVPLQPILRSTDGREVDLRRDALTGSPAEQERHRVARTVLLQLIYDRSLDYWRGWATRGHIGAVCSEAIAEYEALAQAAGLPDRGALWREERYRAEREAIYERWAHALVAVLDLGDPDNRNMVLWAADHISATALAKQLQVPVLWLSLELQGMILPVLAVYTTGRGLHLGYERDVLDTTLNLRLQPGESEAAFLARAKVERLRAVMMAPAAPNRMPKDEHYIKQDVEWLVRRRLDGVSIGQLAREYKATKPDLASDGRRQVQEGIARADAWLNAVGPEAKAVPTASGPNVIGPAPELEALPPLVREMAARLPATAETVAGLQRFMRQVARGPRSKTSTRKRRGARAPRKRNRRR